METSSEEEYREKAKAYYTSTLNMWYTIRLEKDKQLLTLPAYNHNHQVNLKIIQALSKACQEEAGLTKGAKEVVQTLVVRDT